MFYLILATTPVPVGGLVRCMFAVDGDKEVAKKFIREQGVTTPGVRYQLQGPLPADAADSLICCMQTQAPLIAPAQAGQMQGMQGGARPDGQMTQGGFQELGDQSLPSEADDAMFGEASDGTYTDIVLEGGASRELPRQ